MAGCSAIARSGERCRAIAIGGSDYCHAHHPGRAEVRRRAARKGGHRGGRGRPLIEVGEIQSQLADLYQSVLDGSVEPKIGAVLAQIANARARIIETALKAKEQQELEERLEQLEGLLDQRERSRWG